MEQQTPAPAGANPNGSSSTGAHEKSQLTGLEGFFDTYLRIKAPWQLPAAAKEWIVKYGPWISLVLLIIGAVVLIPLLVFALGLTAVTLPFMAAAGTLHSTAFGWFHIALSLVILVMQGIAIPALMKRKLSGWRMLYYAELLSVISSLISVQIFSALVALIIGMYILFQIRSYYK